MAEIKVQERADIPDRFKWNATSVYESDEAWAAEVDRIVADMGHVSRYQGRLGDGPAALAEALTARDALLQRLDQAVSYTYMRYNVDTRDQAGGKMYGRAQELVGQVLGATAFFDPEVLAIGGETLRKWLAEEPALGIYRHYFEDLLRKQQHVRSAEVEELLGMVQSPFMSTQTTANMLANADFKFPPAQTSDGSEIPVTESTLEEILAGNDRAARRTAWEGYSDTFLAFKNTLANNLITAIKQNVFTARARRHPTTLDAALFEYNVPVEVFHNLIGTFRKNLPTWHRYWRLRRKALGVETLAPYDLRAPLAQAGPKIPYEQAVDWISQGLAPMGDEYVQALRKGCLEQRWIDVYPNQGKTAGAFSAGSKGTYPFILISYDDTIYSLSTLAHELGHSMHSYLTWQNQPMVYSDYSMFVAEVASNFHQAMVRAHLLRQKSDAAFQIAVIEEAMANFHRYFFIMPTLARFEYESHRRIERGQGLSADDMIDLMADLFAEGYGEEVEVDRQRVGITWATFVHMYLNYYVFQYATGISAAHALSNRILEGEPGAAEDYLAFLKAGSSLYPLDVLKAAGVDLTTPEPVERTFGILAGLVDRLENLVGA